MEEYHKYVAKDSKGDPVTIPLFCDGLSCERGYLAKKSRTNGRDNWHKLRGLLPSIQEWHLRQLTIQDVFDELFKGHSERVVGTLFQAKNLYGFRQVNSDISTCFNHAVELLHFLTNAHVVAFAQSYITENQINPETLSHENLNKLLETISQTLLDHIIVNINVQQILSVSTIKGGPKNYEYCLCKTERDETMIFCDNT